MTLSLREVTEKAKSLKERVKRMILDLPDNLDIDRIDTLMKEEQ